MTDIVGIEGKSDKVSIFDDKTEDSSDEVGTQLWMYFCNNKPVKGGLSMFVSGNWPRSDQYTGTRGFGNDSKETQHATAIGTRVTRNHKQNLSLGQRVTFTGGHAELC